MALASANKIDISMQSLTDCIYFLNDKCRKGDKCLFRHYQPAAEQTNKCNKWPKTCRNVHCRYRHPSIQSKTEKSLSSIATSQKPGEHVSFFGTSKMYLFRARKILLPLCSVFANDLSLNLVCES